MASPLNITNIPAPRVPLIDQRTNLMSREWYRYFLNLFTLTGGGSNPTSLTDLQLGPPTIETVGENPNNLLAAALDSPTLFSLIDELQKQVQASELDANAAISALQAEITNLSNSVQGLAVAPANTPNLKNRSYGSFYDLNTQTAAAINTAYAISYSNTDLSNGVYIGSPTSRVYVDRYGIYNIQFSAQLDKTSASKGDVWIWLDKNGSTVADTATKVTLQGSNAALVAAWNFLLELNSGDYFRLMWSTNDTDCTIKYISSSSPVPAIPSIILTVTDNISAYQD